ncbi:UNC93-like protein [Trichonephila inaurata madagascariensis]|uniref:UNC93-like protein n=1 Tax=Trichonephila inaurata madagascariensis TaxID=2747483 RepID=A0A8X7CTM7_9ARAC|nr:UNC93-like protein [Trichonephila inaurata madagascariensis]
MKSEREIPDCQDCSSAVKYSSFKNYSKGRILKNFIVLCAGVLLLFTAFNGLAMLQSTMNRKQGVGVTSQAVNYICFCISAVLFPKYVIKKLGKKVTVVISTVMYLPYTASNFYPHFSTLILASVCMGFGAALFWGTQAIYLNDLSVMYANAVLRNKNIDKSDSIIYKNSSSNMLPESCSVKPKQTRSYSCDHLNFYHKHNKKETKVILQSFLYQPPRRNSIANGTILNLTAIENLNNGDYQKFNVTKHFDNNYDTRIMEHNDINNDENTSISLNHEKSVMKFGRLFEVKQQNKKNKLIESTTALLFGIHGSAFLSCFLWSNLLSYYVLESEITQNYASNTSCVCGADYCNIESACFEHNVKEPSNKIRYILVGTFLCLGIACVLLLLLFLDSLEIEKEKEEVSFSMKLLMATCKLAKSKEFILLTPTSFYLGMAQGFYTADFNKSFVACAWGTYHVPLVAMFSGAVCCIVSLSAGWIVKRVGRIPVFFSASIINIATNIFFLFWKPSADEPVLFFVASGLWGIFVAVFWSQLRAFYGVLFKANEEAAFAVFHVWYSLGLALSFAYSNHFCTSAKIYSMIAICTLSFIGYLSVEVLNRKNEGKKIITSASLEFSD